MPLDFGGLLPRAPDIPSETRNILEMYRHGMADQAAHSQNLLRKQIGSTITSQGYLLAADVAFAGGDIQTGLDLQNMPLERQAKFYDVIGRAAMAADTPEKWQRMSDTFIRTFGPDTMKGFEDFSSRESAINLSLTAAQQVEAALAKRRLDIEEAKLGQPDLSMTEIYDEAGRPQKGYFDKNTGTFTPIGKPKAQTGGISFTTAAGDTIEIGGDAGSPGPGGNAALNKTAANTVQTKAINASEMGSRVASMMRDFDPKFLQMGTKLANWWASGKAKINSDLLGDDEKRELNRFAVFQSRSIGNVNRLLNELSGAAVSPQEAERLKAEVPNPGTGWFDGDDPVTFKAKMDRIVTDTDAALARYRYYQAVGIPNNLEEIPLTDVKQVGGKWYVKKDGKWFEV